MDEELEARGISREALGVALEMPLDAINELICGERPVTPKTAAALDNFLGLSTLFWLRSEARYRLTLANNLEVHGHANPFDGPESEWPELQPDEPQPEIQAALPE